MARIDSVRNNRALTPNMNIRQAAPDSARRSNRRSKSDLRQANKHHNKSDPYLRSKKSSINENFPVKQNKTGLRRLKTPAKKLDAERARSAKRKRKSSPGGHFIV